MYSVITRERMGRIEKTLRGKEFPSIEVKNSAFMHIELTPSTGTHISLLPSHSRVSQADESPHMGSHSHEIATIGENMYTRDDEPFRAFNATNS